jgi:hypothetical protein
MSYSYCTKRSPGHTKEQSKRARRESMPWMIRESEEPEIVSDPDDTETINNRNDKATGRELGGAAILACGLVGRRTHSWYS